MSSILYTAYYIEISCLSVGYIICTTLACLAGTQRLWLGLVVSIVADKDLATSHKDLACGHVVSLLSSLLVCYLASWVNEHCFLATKLLLDIVQRSCQASL